MTWKAVDGDCLKWLNRRGIEIVFVRGRRGFQIGNHISTPTVLIRVARTRTRPVQTTLVAISQVPLKRPVENGGEEGVQFNPTLLLVAH